MRHLTLWSVIALIMIGLQCVAGVSTVWAESRGARLELDVPRPVTGKKQVDGKSLAEFVVEQTGKSWALVIGINEYEDQPLAYAKADAESVADLLQQQGFQVTTLYDPQATRSEIMDQLDKLLDRVGKQDRVLIYFAGHGETKQLGEGYAMGYLLPVDAKRDRLGSTAIPMSTIREWANHLRAKHVLFLMDVCYGGIAGQQFRGQPKSAYNVDYLKAITRERGRQLITAGGPKERAVEGPEWNHSVFTYYLLEGIQKGKADLDGDGIIPTTELYAYLNKQVFAAAQSAKHQQRPRLWSMSAETGEFVFVVAQGPAVTVGEDSRATSDEFARMKAELAVLKAQLAQTGNVPKAGDSSKAEVPSTRKQVTKASGQSHRAGREIVGKDGAPMVRIPAGSFLMGSTKEEVDRAITGCTNVRGKDQQTCEGGYRPELPQHQVQLGPFYLDTYEVTNRLFQRFVQQTGYRTTAEGEGSARSFVEGKGWEDVKGAYWQRPEAGVTVFDSSRAEHPVVSVSWVDAQAYCQWAEKRLPTEAEWEYSARAGTTTAYWWGDGPPGARLVENIADEAAKHLLKAIMFEYHDGAVRTAPVGSYEANPWGLHDISGNVREWTADWYEKEYYGKSPLHDPTGPSSGQFRVARGGSWDSGPVDVRSADRGGGMPTKRDDDLGFRCAQDVLR